MTGKLDPPALLRLNLMEARRPEYVDRVTDVSLPSAEAKVASPSETSQTVEVVLESQNLDTRPHAVEAIPRAGKNLIVPVTHPIWCMSIRVKSPPVRSEVAEPPENPPMVERVHKIQNMVSLEIPPTVGVIQMDMKDLVWTVTTETEQSQEAQNASTEVISYIQSFRTPAATVEISHSSFPPIVKKEVGQTKTDLTTKRESNQSTASSAEIRSSISPLITSQPSNSSTVPSTTEEGNDSETETTLEDKSTHSSTMAMQAAETLKSVIYPTTAQISQSSTALTIKAETTQSIAPVTRMKIEQSSLAPLIKAEMGQYARILNTSGTTGKFRSPSLIVEGTSHSTTSHSTSVASTTTKGISDSLTSLAFEAETSQPAKVSIQAEYRQLLTAANGITSPISRETTYFMKVTAFKEETTKVTAFKEETNQSPAAPFATLETNPSVTSQITIAETNQPSTAIRTRIETRQSPNVPTMTPELRHSNADSSMKPANNQSLTSLFIGSEMRKMSTRHNTLGEIHELSSTGIIAEAVTQLPTTQTTVAVASRSFTNPRFEVEIAELSTTNTAQTSLSTSPPNTVAKSKQPYASSVSEAASSQSSAGLTSKKEISQSSLSPTTTMEIKQLLTKSSASGENVQSSTSPTIIAKIKQSTVHFTNTVGITQWLTDSQTPAETYLSTPAKLTVEMDQNSTIPSALEETNRSSVMSATKPEPSQSSKPLTTKPTSGQSPTLPIRTAEIPQLMAVLGTSSTTFEVSQAATIEAETIHSMLALTAAEDINQSSSASLTALESKQLSTAKPIIVVETGIRETRQSSLAPPITRETTQLARSPVYKEETKHSTAAPFSTLETNPSVTSQITLAETNQPSTATRTRTETRQSPNMTPELRHSTTASSIKPANNQSFTSLIIESEMRKMSTGHATLGEIHELSSTGIVTEAVTQLQTTQTTVAVASQSFTNPRFAVEIAELSTTNNAQTSLSTSPQNTVAKNKQPYASSVSEAASSQSSAGLTSKKEISQSSLSPTTTMEIKQLLTKSSASGENVQSSTSPTIIAKIKQSTIHLANTVGITQWLTDSQTPAETYLSTPAKLTVEMDQNSTIPSALEETNRSSVMSATKPEPSQSSKPLTTKPTSGQSPSLPIRTAEIPQLMAVLATSGTTFQVSQAATIEAETIHSMLALTAAEDINQSSPASLAALESKQLSTAKPIIVVETGIQESRESSVAPPITRETTQLAKSTVYKEETKHSTAAPFSTLETNPSVTSQITLAETNQPSTDTRTRTETRQSPTMTPELRHSTTASSIKPANNQSFTSLIIESEMRKMSTGHATLGEIHELSSTGIVTEAVTQLPITQTTVALASQSFTNPRFAVELAELSATNNAQTSLSTSPPNTVAKNKQPNASSVSEAASSQSSAGLTSKKEISQSSLSPTTTMEIKQLLTKSSASGENVQSSTSPTIIAKTKQSTIHLANTVGITQWLTDSQTPAETYLSTPAKLTVEMDQNSTIPSALEETNRSSVMSATKPEPSQSSKPLTTKPTSGQSPSLPIRTAEIPQLMAVLATSGTTFQVSQAATIEAETIHSMLALTAAEDINQSSPASLAALESKQLSTAKPIIVVETGIQESRESSVAPPITRETTQFAKSTVYKEETKHSTAAPFSTLETNPSVTSQITLAETNQPSTATRTRTETRQSPTMTPELRHSTTASSIKPANNQSFTSLIIESEMRKMSTGHATLGEIHELSSTGIVTEAVTQLPITQTTVALASQSFTNPRFAVELAELSATNNAQTSLSTSPPNTVAKNKQPNASSVSEAASSQSSAGLTSKKEISQSSLSPTTTMEIKQLLTKSSASGENVQSSTFPTIIAKIKQSTIHLANTVGITQWLTDSQTPAETYLSTPAKLTVEMDQNSTIPSALEETNRSSVMSATKPEPSQSSKPLTTKPTSGQSRTLPIRTAEIPQLMAVLGTSGTTFQVSQAATIEVETIHSMLALTAAEDINQSSSASPTALESKQLSTAKPTIIVETGIQETRQSSVAPAITRETTQFAKSTETRQSPTVQFTTPEISQSSSSEKKITETNQSSSTITKIEIRKSSSAPTMTADIRHSPTPSSLKRTSNQSFTSQIIGSEIRKISRAQNTPEKKSELSSTGIMTKAVSQLQTTQTTVALASQSFTHPTFAVEIAELSTTNTAQTSLSSSVPTTTAKIRQQYTTSVVSTAGSSQSSAGLTATTEISQSSISSAGLTPTITKEIKPLLPKSTASGENMQSSTTPTFIAKTMQSFIPLANTTATAQQSTDLQTPAEIYSSTFANLRAEVNHHSTLSTAIEETSVIAATAQETSLTTKAASSSSLTRPIRTAKVQQSETAFGNFGPTFASSQDRIIETEINHSMLALTPAEDVNQSSTTLEVRQSSTATVITGEKRQSSTSQTTTGKTALSVSKETSESTKAATSTVEMKQLFTSPSSILEIRQHPTVQMITGINIQSTPSSIMTAETSQFPRTKREGIIQSLTASTTKAERELSADQNEAVTRQLPTAPAITVEVSQHSTATGQFVKSETQSFSTYLETRLPSRDSLNTILSTHLFTSSIISPEVSQSSIAPIIKVETMKSSTAPIIIKQTNLPAALTVSSRISIPATEPTTPTPTIQSSTASTIKSNGIQLTAFPITEIETRQSLRGTFASEKNSESVEALNMKTASYVTAESSQLPTIPLITSQSSRWEKETIQSTGQNIKTEPILSSNIPIITSDTRQPFITATNVIQSADPLKTTHIGQLIQKSSSAPPLTAANTTSLPIWQLLIAHNTSVEVPKSATSEPTRTEPSGSAANSKQTIQTSTVLQTTQTVHSGALCDQGDCLWSPWYNIYTPSRTSDDGDFETFQNIRARGFDVCEAPRDVSCRSVKFAYIPFAKLPNNATCSVTEGLKCYNRDNTPNGCLDYQIRVLCCLCQRGGSPPALPARVTTPPTLLAALPDSTIKTQTGQPKTAHTSSTSSVPVHSGALCDQGDCLWSPWYNIYTPSRTSDDGDFETFQNIRARGFDVCEAPRDVSCRSVKFAYIPFAKLPNNATCSVTEGLKCYNRDNTPNGCLDYQIRVLCCLCQRGGSPPALPARVTTPPTLLAALPDSTIKTQTGQPKTAHTSSTSSVPAQKMSLCNQSACEWSPWYNVYTPSRRSDDGDFETFENIRVQGYGIFPKTPPCDMSDCVWSPWYNVYRPRRSSDDGDFETFENIRAWGYAVCEAPSDVSCRSVRFSYIPFPQLPNTATCSVTYGLKCYNRDNEPNGCLDYEIRVLCCPCQQGGLTSTTSATATSPITIPTALPKSTITIQTSPRLTARTTTSTTTVPVQKTTPCNQRACEWSPWYNVYTPSKQSDDGDFETYENIRAQGYAVCEAPSDVSCRSVRFSYIPFPQLPNTATCSVAYGLKCYNRDNEPNGCLDYEIRVLCCPCEQGGLTSTTSATRTSPITIPTALPKSTITVQTSPRLTSRTTTSTTTVPVQKTTPCNQRACEWSPWYNVYTPSKQSDDGDFETYENIRAQGYAVCEAPSDVSCRSVRFSYIPFPQLPNTATCSVAYGLKCYNRDNEPNGCLDYEIRVLCCPCEQGGLTSTTSATRTSPITIPTALPKSTITVQTSPRLTARTTTSTTTVPVQKTTPCNQRACEWSPWYNVYTPSKQSDDGDFETYENIRAQGYAVCEAPSDVSCRSVRFSYIPFPQLPNTATCSVAYGLKCYNRDNEPNGCLDYEIRVLCCPCEQGGLTSTTSATRTSPITIPTALPKSTITVQTSPRLTARTTTSTTTVPVQKTTPCNQRACEWSPWYNVYTPSKQSDDGDFETYENIRAQGYAVCEAPSDVSCRSVRFSYIPFPQLPNTATCSVAYGLKCYNRDNEPNGCLDYEIRVLCCPCEQGGLTSTTSATRTSPITIPTALPKSTITVQTSPRLTARTTTSTTNVPVQKIPPCNQSTCEWSPWYNVYTPSKRFDDGDFETYENIRARGYAVCEAPSDVSCRFKGETRYRSIKEKHSLTYNFKYFMNLRHDIRYS
ncbi:streptococcal hemagglutinin-like [Ambystoma mexicanum]|uniref:streptococcal hemagglutinin-like n=1 Tax=Ambystoma mexicanum TaxID=8296 RepID=UPI0037E7444D